MTMYSANQCMSFHSKYVRSAIIEMWPIGKLCRTGAPSGASSMRLGIGGIVVVVLLASVSSFHVGDAASSDACREPVAPLVAHA